MIEFIEKYNIQLRKSQDKKMWTNKGYEREQIKSFHEEKHSRKVKNLGKNGLQLLLVFV
jgi:hypothetical protein